MRAGAASSMEITSRLGGPHGGKTLLVDAVNHEVNAGFDWKVLTIGFARRATAYKRATLIFHDIERLKAIAKQVGPVPIGFCRQGTPSRRRRQGRHSRDLQILDALRGHVPVAYLANYDMALARMLCAGVDVWLNTPLPPMEVSGTSGMKAAVNGVPSLSILDACGLRAISRTSRSGRSEIARKQARSRNPDWTHVMRRPSITSSPRRFCLFFQIP